MDYELRDSQFLVVDEANEYIDGPDVKDHLRTDALTRVKMTVGSGIVVRKSNGAVMSWFGKSGSDIADRWCRALKLTNAHGAA